jgi:hypothetical protein
MLVAACAALSSCFDFHLTGPEDPSPVPSPRLVDVTIEYRQPSACLNTTRSCEGDVIFYASWMRPGTSFPLTPDIGNHTYRGVAQAVPVNFPPRDFPYDVMVDDPYLRETATRGVTASRLRVGGEALIKIVNAGTDQERALVYIDENGFGRNPN